MVIEVIEPLFSLFCYVQFGQINMHEPKISVIIPTYNRAHCVKDAIDSVLAQSFRDFELIVVDDGSTDGTSKVVSAYGDRLKMIRQVNSGVSAARNAGIEASHGKWVAFLDSDDTWEPDKLKVQAEDLRGNRGVVAHMVDGIICDVQTPYLSLFELRGLRDEFARKPFRERALCDVLMTPFFTSCWMLRRKALEAAGFFDPSMKVFEDFDLLTRIALEGPFFVNCYLGSNVRRRPGGSFSLSNLYQREQVQSLENLVHTYRRLKLDMRLTSSERQHVCRSLSGIRCELAAQHRLEKQWRESIAALFNSVVDDPGLRSIARAVLVATGIKAIITKMWPWHRKKRSFRRSEMEAPSLDKKSSL